MIHPSLTELLQEFLKERRESDRGGYAPVTKEDLEQLHEIIGKLIEFKWEADCDGDRPVEWHLTDRTKYQRDRYVAVPHAHLGMAEDAFDSEVFEQYMSNVLLNNSIANDEMQRLHRLMLNISREIRDKRKKEKDRLQKEIEEEERRRGTR